MDGTMHSGTHPNSRQATRLDAITGRYDGWLLGADGSEQALDHGSKALLASRVLDALGPLLREQAGSGSGA